MGKITHQIASKIKILNLVYIKCLEMIKYNLDRSISDYIELSVSVALTCGLGNKLVTYLERPKFLDTTKTDSVLVEKFSKIMEDYIGQNMETKLLLKNFGAIESLNIDGKISTTLKELAKIPKDIVSSHVIGILAPQENAEAKIKMGGNVEDSDVIELGGFLESPIISYPTNLFSTIDRLVQNEEAKKSKKKEMIEKWTVYIESYFSKVVSSVLLYLEKRAKYNEYDDPMMAKKMEKIAGLKLDDVLEVIEMIKEQDNNILLDKVKKSETLSPETIEKNMEIIKILRLDPKRRSEVISEIDENISQFEKDYHDLPDVHSDNIDAKMINLIENLNKFGYALDYLLSKENKITCINNIYLVINTYSSIMTSLRDHELKKNIRIDSEKYLEYADFLERLMKLPAVSGDEDRINRTGKRLAKIILKQ